MREECARTYGLFSFCDLIPNILFYFFPFSYPLLCILCDDSYSRAFLVRVGRHFKGTTVNRTFFCERIWQKMFSFRSSLQVTVICKRYFFYILWALHLCTRWNKNPKYASIFSHQGSLKNVLQQITKKYIMDVDRICKSKKNNEYIIIKSSFLWVKMLFLQSMAES